VCYYLRKGMPPNEKSLIVLIDEGRDGAMVRNESKSPVFGAVSRPDCNISSLRYFPEATGNSVVVR
jgi:hypothetical protein